MSVEHVSRLLEDLLRKLDAVDLEPNPLRTDWKEQRALLDRVGGALDDLAKAGDEFVAELDTDDERQQARVELCVPALRAAGLFFAAGRKDQARACLKQRRVGLDDSDIGREIDLALADLPTYARLCHARWLLRLGRAQDAKTQASTLLDTPFGDAARRVLEQPEPIAAAPALVSLNGFGMQVHGQRDRWPDGSYVVTRFITALFVPILPLDAYRVIPYEEGYSFLGKVPLGRVAIWWRRLLVTLVLVSGVGFGGHQYWQSPGKRLERATAALVKEENSASDADAREQLMRRHEELMDEYSELVTPAELDPSSGAIARLATAEVKLPMSPEQTDTALKGVRRYAAIPLELRSGSSSKWVSDTIESWVTSLGEGSDSTLSSSLRLLELGSRTLAPADAARLEAHEHRLALRLADLLAKDWPLAAVKICAKLADLPEAASCGARIDALGDDMSTLVELGPELRLFADKTRASDYERATKLLARVERAKQAYDSPARKALLESEDEGKLRTAHLADTHDQELAVLIADIERGRGELDRAKKTLESLGVTGKLVWKAQHELAIVLGDLGEVDRAKKLLEHMLSERLPEYEAATLDYARGASALQKKLLAQARAGEVPEEIGRRFEAASEDDREKVFNDWLEEETNDDPKLAEQRDAITRASDVVPTAITLGTLELRRATAATGEERERRLAAAERSFLAIRSGGEGLPSYHLGLGQVYYRLGKSEEGEHELGQLLASDDPEMSLQVARAFRDLGMESRTRAICQKIHASGPANAKNDAATLMSLIASTREERALWLKRADTSDDFVQTSLLEIEAETLFEAGKPTEADAKYAEAFQRHFKNAKHSSAAANNAALVLNSRYQCTGDRAHLDRAIQLLESARTLEAESALVLINTAPLLQYRAMLKVLSTWLKLPILKLDSSDAELLIDTLLGGEHRDVILSELRSSADVRRAIELWRQAEVLAPRRTEVYAGQLEWVLRFEDDSQLGVLKERIRRASLDTIETSANRVAYVEGKRNESMTRAMNGEVARLEAIARELGGPTDKRSLAAVRVLESAAHNRLTFVHADPLLHARRALEAFREADQLWPEIGAKAGLDGDLLLVALVAAAKKSPATFPNFEADLRDVGGSLYLYRALDRGSEPVLAAVRAEPEWAEAVRLRKELAPKDPGTTDWLLGRIANDSELVADGKKGAKESVLVGAELGARLSPGAASEMRLTFVRAVKK